MDTTVAPIAAMVVGLVAGVVGWLAGGRGRAKRYARSLEALTSQVRSGALSGEPADEEPAEVRAMHRAMAEGWVPRGSEWHRALRATLGRVADYMEASIAEPLREGIAGDGRVLREKAHQVVDAVEDVAFFVEEVSHDLSVHDLTRTLQELTREYTSDYGVPVTLRAAGEPIRARLAPEAFKDAVFLVLVNAGRFGGGTPVEVTLMEDGGRARIRICDRGPGFAEEALQRAMDPFYTTERGALGLGLSHARELIASLGGEIWLRNREEGGGEVEISIPRVP